MKIFWILFSIWTGGDGSDMYVFEKPVFEQKIECENFVRFNFPVLNDHVNDVHDGKGEIPNLFYCIRADELKEKISSWEKGQKI